MLAQMKPQNHEVITFLTNLHDTMFIIQHQAFFDRIHRIKQDWCCRAANTQNPAQSCQKKSVVGVGCRPLAFMIPYSAVLPSA